MNKSVLLVFTILFFLMTPHFTNANVSVEVNNTQPGSNSHININNKVTTTIEKHSSTDVHTDIRVETNGEVKEVHSDKQENISVESNNGNSSVRIEQNNTTQPTISQKKETNDSVHIRVKGDTVQTQVNGKDIGNENTSLDVVEIKKEKSSLLQTISVTLKNITLFLEHLF